MTSSANFDLNNIVNELTEHVVRANRQITVDDAIFDLYCNVDHDVFEAFVAEAVGATPEDERLDAEEFREVHRDDFVQELYRSVQREAPELFETLA